MNVPAWAENAVIVSDTGSSVRYHAKCPYCGKINTMQTGSASVMHSIHTTSGVCTYCHKSFTIRFGRK